MFWMPRSAGWACCASIASPICSTWPKCSANSRGPKGNRLTIVTNAGGPAVLATDALIGSGGELAEISAETIEALNQLLPAAWSHGNPIDILGDAGPERYAKSLEIAAKDPNSDGLLVVLTPQAMTDPTKTAEALKTVCEAGRTSRCWPVGWAGPRSRAGVDISEPRRHPRIPLSRHRRASVPIHVVATRTTCAGCTRRRRPRSPAICTDAAWPKTSSTGVQNAGRTLLTEFESKNLLAAYGIPTVDTRVATTADEAVAKAESIGFPVVLKLFSETITHKTDVGGVKLNLNSAEAVRDAFNTIQASVREKAGAEHFQGVTVQPMVKLSGGYEIIIGSRSIRSSARCCYSGWAANWSRCSRIAPWRCRR